MLPGPPTAHWSNVCKKMTSECSFDLLLSRPLRFGIWSIDDERWLATFRDIFKSFDIQDIVSASALTCSESRLPPHRHQIIPKVIHHIWLGSEFPLHFRQLRQVYIDATKWPPSALSLNHLQGWIEAHEELGWTFILWDDEKVQDELLRR